MYSSVLYVFTHSVWSGAARLAKHDLGFTDAEVEEKQVRLDLGEHLQPPFLNINPKGTVPTLVADGQTYQDSVAVIKYLIKNTRGSARNESVKPIVNELQKLVHSLVAIKFGMHNEEEFQVARKLWFKFISNRQIKMEALASQDNAAAKEYWAPRRDENTLLFRVYSGTVSEEEKQEFYAWTKGHQATLTGFIANVLPTHLPETGFIDGAEPGINDFELGGWLASTIGTAGGFYNIERFIEKPLDEKVVEYFESWKGRRGWQIAYEPGHQKQSTESELE